MDVPFEVIDAHQRLAERHRQRLAVNQSNQQRPNQPGTFRHCQAVSRTRGDAGPAASLVYNGRDAAQVFARSQFRHHASVLFRGPESGNATTLEKNALAVSHHGCRCFVAARFNAEN